MRIIEKEGLRGFILILAALLISVIFLGAFFSLIILAIGIYWYYIFSSKMMNPKYSNGLVSPINGVVTKSSVSNEYIHLRIKSRDNTRVHAPIDFEASSLKIRHGFTFIKKFDNFEKFCRSETLKGNFSINDRNYSIEMRMQPMIFNSCKFKQLSGEVLFFDNIGFLNFGYLDLIISNDNSSSLNVKEGDSLSAGITNLISYEKIK